MPNRPPASRCSALFLRRCRSRAVGSRRRPVCWDPCARRCARSDLSRQRIWRTGRTGRDVAVFRRLACVVGHLRGRTDRRCVVSQRRIVHRMRLLLRRTWLERLHHLGSCQGGTAC